MNGSMCERSCRYLMHISYIGTKYRGFQRNSSRSLILSEGPKDDSIQHTIECALQTQLRPLNIPRLALGSRTDAGVHALLNTCHVDLIHPTQAIYQSSDITSLTNQYLQNHGHEIIILKTQFVSNSFHCRKNAKSRSYVYRIAITNEQQKELPISQSFRFYQIRKPDFDKMEKVMNLFVGEHDFKTFITSDPRLGSTVRTIEEFDFRPVIGMDSKHLQMFEFYIKGPSFLYNQIRRMISCIIAAGHDIISYDTVKWMLENPAHSNLKCLRLAPPYGLWLQNIFYDENDFLLNNIRISSV